MASSLDMNYIVKLVRLAQNGDSNAFAELYMATFQRLYRFSFIYLRDQYLAQDALQETYIKALQHLHQLRDPALIISWLEQINLRTCYHMQHKNRRYTTVESDVLDAVPDPRQESDPESEVVRIDYNDFLMKQILNLPFTEGNVLVLRYYKNMKIDEIADLMEISPSTVKRSIKSGINRLKNKVQL